MPIPGPRPGSRHPLARASRWLALSLMTLRLEGGDDLRRQHLSLDGAEPFLRLPSDSEIILLSPRLTPSIAWDQLVVSWNLESSPGGYAMIGVRLVFPDRTSTVYHLGIWSTDPSHTVQTSLPGQSDADATVETDTLIARHRGASVELLITLGTAPGGRIPRLKRVDLAFADTSAAESGTPRSAIASGISLPVPERSQLDYEGGRSWCSPTCLSMVLSYWSHCLHRPELDLPVPQVAASVFDPAWPGTGNWTFNTAFAGGFDGLDASVRRLSAVTDLEEWIVRGVPVIASVSYGLLKGARARAGDGHLVVCIGFTHTGDPIIHDPGTRHDIRKIIPRDQFARAWNSSHNTVYLLQPTQPPAVAHRPYDAVSD